MSEATEVGSVFVSNYPPYSFWQHEQLPEVEQALDAPARPDVPLGLYLHIPFCRKRCHFCYFRIFTDRDASDILRYIDALAREVELYASRPAVAGRPLNFVYFGGGTPSFISVDHLKRLATAVKSHMSWDSAREITFECEPGTLSQPKLEAIRELGVTRLSLGIENFDDAILSANGRAHLSKEIHRVKPWIDALKFPQLNIDLIAGMAGETWESWRETVKKTIDYGPSSVTVYQMEVPHNTTFSKELSSGAPGAAALPNWEQKRAWHAFAFEQLGQAGYVASSAYTMVKPSEHQGFVYRDSVWLGYDMLGTGVASFSHVSGVHFQNLDSWDQYLASLDAGQLPLNRAFKTSRSEQLTRELILQLKFGQLDTGRFKSKFGIDVLDAYKTQFERLSRDDLIDVNDGQIQLSQAGLMIVDSLLPQFYDERYQNARYT